MRILYVTQSSLDGNGAAERHGRGVTRGLAALGHEVQVVAPQNGMRKAKRGPARMMRPVRAARAGALLEARQSLSVSALVARERPDVACVRLGATTALVPRVLEVAAVPTVLEIDGALLDRLDRLGGALAAGLTRRLLARVARRAAAIVVPEAAVAERARAGLGARSVEVIENGCDLAIAVPGSRRRARRALGLPADQPCVAFTGALSSDQDLDLLLAASAIDGVLLLVAGDGKGAERMLAAAARLPETSLRFLGAVAHERAIEIARAADACLDLAPAQVGAKCLEYAALGRRMVAFEAPGADRLRGLYPDHEVFFPLRGGAPGEVREAVARALAAERAAPLPAAAVAAARRGLGWEATARELARVLEARLERMPPAEVRAAAAA